MKNDIISVIIPFYNAEQHIEKCIKSVINQTYKNLDIILINDGSIDESLSIVNKFSQMDDRIKIINKQNGGVSSARNKGLKNAQGNYIYFVDSDDYIEKDCLQILYNKIKSTDSDIVRANFFENKNKKFRFKEDMTIEMTNLEEKHKMLEKVFKTYDFNSVWGQLINKRILNNVTFDEDLKMAEDFKFNLNIIEKSKRISLISNFLYNYNKNDLGINFNKDISKVERKIKDITKVYSELYYQNYDKNLIFSRLLREIVPQFLEMYNYKDEEIKKIIKFINKEKIFTEAKEKFNINKLKKSKYFIAYKYFLEKKWFQLKIYYILIIKPLKKLKNNFEKNKKILRR